MSTRNRPRIVVALMVSLAALALTPKAALAHEGEGACSNASLKETIALSCSGTAGITPTSTGVHGHRGRRPYLQWKRRRLRNTDGYGERRALLGPFCLIHGHLYGQSGLYVFGNVQPPGASMTNFDGAIFQSGFFAMETDAGTAVLCVQNKQ